jgi:hypothetical protein
VAQEARIEILLSGFGRVHVVAEKTESHLEILFISDKRVESLAAADWEEKLKNAIVARIARITMTTKSSTRVNQVVFGFWFLVFMSNCGFDIVFICACIICKNYK